MPNFSSLAGLEVAEKFVLGGGGVGGGIPSIMSSKEKKMCVTSIIGVTWMT